MATTKTWYRGWMNLDEETRRAMARRGGLAASAKGTAHRWTTATAAVAGRKGGLARKGRRHDATMEWRAIAQVVTTARFRRPLNPRRCNAHRYHVWRWKALATDPNAQPIDGMKCQCGALPWTYRNQHPEER